MYIYLYIFIYQSVRIYHMFIWAPEPGYLIVVFTTITSVLAPTSVTLQCYNPLLLGSNKRSYIKKSFM